VTAAAIKPRYVTIAGKTRPGETACVALYCTPRSEICAAPQLFDLVADVERYPEFLPWVVETRIRRRKNRKISST
jgi:Polyketide cyclase / dehydrase and lipid transport